MQCTAFASIQTADVCLSSFVKVDNTTLFIRAYIYVCVCGLRLRNRQDLPLVVQRAALRKPRSKPRRLPLMSAADITQLEDHLARLEELSRDEACHFATVFSVGDSGCIYMSALHDSDLEFHVR